VVAKGKCFYRDMFGKRNLRFNFEIGKSELPRAGKLLQLNAEPLLMRKDVDIEVIILPESLRYRRQSGLLKLNPPVEPWS